MRKALLVSFALLFFLASAYAAPPTVDFNWFFNGVKDGPAVAFQNIIFDPQVTSSPDANIMRWQFDTDGNVNYTNFGNSFFSDNFSSGLLTGYTINFGGWTAASNNLATTGSLQSEIYRGGLNYNSTQAKLFISYKAYIGDTTINSSFNWFSRNTSSRTTGYWIIIGTAGSALYRNTTLIASFAGLTPLVFHDINVSNDTNGDIDVYVDSVKVAAVNDTTYSDGNNFIFDSLDSASQVIFDDINISNGFATSINIDKNENHTFTSVGTKVVCLTVGNSDGNTTTCHSIVIGGNVTFTVFDENTNTKLFNAKAIFNGVTYSADSNGIISIPTLTTMAEYPISIFDSNHEIRVFTLNISVDAAIQLSVYLIDNKTDRFYDFLVKDINAVKYPNKFFRIMKNGFYVWSGYLDSDAIENNIPLANLTTDYNFFVDVNSNPATNIFSYGDSNVNVLVPINEKTLVLISPWQIRVTNNTSIDANNLTTNYVFKIYPNTLHPYKIVVDANTLSYFPRYYSVRALGGENITLQPYLLRPIDLAAIGTFQVSDSFTGQHLQNILIKFYADVGSSANVLVESPETDSAGEFLFSSITGKTYNLEIYNSKGDLIKTGSFISSTSTTYFLDLFSGSISTVIPTNGFIDLNILNPTNGILYLNDSNNHGFSFILNKTGVTVTFISICHDQGVLGGGPLLCSSIAVYFPTFPETSFGNQQIFDYNFVGGDESLPVNFYVGLATSQGNIQKKYTYILRNSQEPSGFNFKVEFGEFGGIVVWFLVFVILGFFIRFNPLFGVDNSAMIWILVIWTGIASYVGLVDVFFGFVGLLLGVAYWSLQHRPLG